MSDPLDDEFIAAQRRRLESLRDRIADTQARADRADGGREGDERAVEDSGEEGAGEARRSREQALGANLRLQLADVARALEKIAEGSYGVSDESGEPIPRARLEAVPEANLTVAEEAEREQRQAAGERANPPAN